MIGRKEVERAVTRCTVIAEEWGDGGESFAAACRHFGVDPDGLREVCREVTAHLPPSVHLEAATGVAIGFLAGFIAQHEESS